MFKNFQRNSLINSLFFVNEFLQDINFYKERYLIFFFKKQTDVEMIVLIVKYEKINIYLNYFLFYFIIYMNKYK